MFKPKEIISILLAIIVGAFVMSFSNIGRYPSILLTFAIIVIINIIVKQIAAYYYFDANIETKIWQFRRYGYYKRSYLKYPFPIGIILPFILALISYGMLKWLALLQTDITASGARKAKRHGLYRFSEMTEGHIGLIVGWGIIANLIASVIGYLIGQPEFTRISIYYAFYNMLPFGSLDGTKIFFGSRVFWTILFTICVIFLLYAIFLV